MDRSVSLNTVRHANGDTNWWGIGTFVVSVLVSAFIIYQGYLAIRRTKIDEVVQAKKMQELELNLRQVLGNKYQTTA